MFFSPAYTEDPYDRQIRRTFDTEGDIPTQNHVCVDVFQKYLLISAPDLILGGPWSSPLPVEMANFYIDLYNVDVLGFRMNV